MQRISAGATALAFLLAACGGSTPSPSPIATGSVTAGSTAAPSSAPLPTATPALRPTPRTSASMAWDPTHEQVLLYGGDTSSGASNILEAWSRLEGTAPPARNGQAAAFDPIRHQLVLFGGFVGQTVLGGTWLLDDGAWREVSR
ncbi:MAG: hypothetical protein ABIZ52_03585 [Candidatus Limnocylindrales bacterium]